MPGKAIILLTLGMIIITGLMLTGILRSSNNISKNMVSDYQRKVTYNIAQSGANIGIKKFRLDSLYSGDDYSMMGGKVNIRVKDTTLTYGATVKTVHAVISTGYTNSGSNQVSFTSMAIPYPVYTLTWVKGAYTSNSYVVPSGSGIIDGREHDTAGTLIPGGFGTIGVWSTNKINLDGSVDVYGSAGGKDYGKFTQKSDTNAPGYQLVIVDNQAPPAGGYPYSPDDIMGGPASGFYPGTILNSAIYQGHYYPLGSSLPDASKNPFSGVTFIDLNATKAGSLPSGNLDISGSGLIVINNTDPLTPLYIPNLMGNFQGFVILSNNTNIEIYKAQIVGGLQTTSPKYTKSSLNAGSYIRYSSEAIKKALFVITAQKAQWFEKQNYFTNQ